MEETPMDKKESKTDIPGKTIIGNGGLEARWDEMGRWKMNASEDKRL